MADKVWSQEQREAAAEKLSSRQAGDDGRIFFYANGYSHRTWAIDLQCELTAKDAELAEAVELLEISMHKFESVGPSSMAARIGKWLERNTPQEVSDAGSVLQQTEGSVEASDVR